MHLGKYLGELCDGIAHIWRHIRSTQSTFIEGFAGIGEPLRVDKGCLITLKHQKVKEIVFKDKLDSFIH